MRESSSTTKILSGREAVWDMARWEMCNSGNSATLEPEDRPNPPISTHCYICIWALFVLYAITVDRECLCRGARFSASPRSFAKKGLIPMSVLRPSSPLWLAAACLAFAALPVRAQVQPVPQNVVQLSASGVVEGPQDFLSLTLSTTREAPDAAAVQTQLKAAVDAALAEARKTAAPGQMEVRSGAFSLYPRHNKDGRISAWQGTAELVLEGRDF